MERYPVRDEVWWTGAIDWNVRDFHGYETPRGTTYNAYLILDEKVALVDGCREGFGPEMLARVRDCCSGRQIDYLVINHVEPDHSGALPWLIEQLMPANILCSKKATEALARYYGSETVDRWTLQIVGTGDEVPLGRNTLQFIEAPMLHWPDSMFTYVKGSKTLLPNDGFGQHLATSRRFADEVDMSVVMEEAGKYYANILMPYGSPAQKIIGKIAELGLEIEVIAPSHGVIWRKPEDVQRILGAYQEWSTFQAPEKVSVFYDTMWHSTEMMAMAIVEGVTQVGVECSVCRLNVTSRAEIARLVLESRAFLVGTPTLNSNVFPTVGGLLSYVKGLRPKNRIVGAFGSRGWAGGGVKTVDAELRSMGLEVLDPLEVKYRPSEEELQLCEQLGRDVALKARALGGI